VLHTGWYTHRRIVDTPVYRLYGEAMTSGQVPYRDFAVEYPPAALPTFVLPALGPSDRYDRLFETLMLVCAAAGVCLLAAALGAVGAGPVRLYGAVAFAALAPLLLGSVVLTRFDFWPAALATGALAAFVAGRNRVGMAVLAVAVAAKAYPAVVLPLALVYVWRARGRREALLALGIFAVLLAALVVPFALIAPHGLAASVRDQTGRPLQIESLGSSFLLVGHRLGLYEPHVVTSHGSQNLAGGLPDALATVETALQVAAVAAVWLLFAARSRTREGLLIASAAAVVGFVAFDKVLSPQFMIWLIPLVPLVAGRLGAWATGLLAAALVLTQIWFPYRYWHLVALSSSAWLVLARDVVLVALFVSLLAAIRREAEAPGSS
jgi:uncharacterized membrane protein